MNIFVCEKNSNLMPVKTDYIIVSEIISHDGEHFYYNDFEDVNYPFLTDIFEIKNMIYSIGDLLMFCSYVFLLGLITFFIINESKLQKVKKRLNLNSRKKKVI